ncbi:MAG: glycosyltransferase [Prochlorotrichaceae cyanobacterium]
MSKPLKVLQVVPSVSPVRGGATTAVLELVRSLLQQGVETEIITTNDNGPGVLDVPLWERLDFEGIPVTFFPRWSPPLRGLTEFAISPAHTRWLAKHLHRYDLLEIHATFSYVCTAAGYVARRQQHPYLICPHGQFSPWVIQQKTRKKLLYNRLFEQENFRQVWGVHCTTVAEVENVKAFGITAPAFSIPLGVTVADPVPDAADRLRQRYQIPSDRTILLFLSRFHPKKRPDFLLSVLAHCQDTNFHLVLAGDGDPDYRAFLETCIDNSGLRDRVTLPGFLTGEAKALALYGSDLFVLPSYGENFGIAVAEAMAVGLPVMITPEVEISDEIADQAAGWVVPGQEEAWQMALREALTTPALREQRGQNGKAYAQTHYNWETIGQGLVEAYHKILSPARESP